MKQLIFLFLLFISSFTYGQCADEDTVRSNTVSLITFNSARINGSITHFTSPGTVTAINLVYVRAGQTDTATSTGGPTSTLRNLTGLQANTQYYYYYSTVCGGSSNNQLGTYTFTTVSNTVGYTPESHRSFPYVKIDSGFAIPFRDTTIGRGIDRPGPMVINTADSLPYYYNGVSWAPVYVDSAGVIDLINMKVDSVTLSSDTLYYWIGGVSYGQVFFAVTDASNGVYLDGKTVKLGTNPLTENTSIVLGTNDFIIEGDNGGVDITSGSTNIGAKSTNRNSYIQFATDSISIKPGFGALTIDTLTSAVGTKALRYNPTTGLVSYADTTIGGGSTDLQNKNYQNYADTIATQTILAGDTLYYAFPSLTRTSTGRMLLGFDKAGSHTSGGLPATMYSDDFGITWSGVTDIETDSATNYRCFQVSAYLDTIYANYWTAAGTVYFRKSTDNGATWSSRTTITTGRTSATEGQIVVFNNTLVMPIYSNSPSPLNSGFVTSTDWGTTWSSPTWLTSPDQLNECNMVISSAGDSLIAFFRNGAYTDTLYRATSADAVTWTTLVPTVPEGYYASKPAVLMMPDGRILLDCRKDGVPKYGRLSISNDGGFTWNTIDDQQVLYPFAYGSMAYIGDDYYLNVFSTDNTPPFARLRSYIYKIPDITYENTSTGIVAKNYGNPIWNYYINRQIAAGVATISPAGVTGDVQMKSGTAFAAVPGLNYTAGTLTFTNILDPAGAGTNSVRVGGGSAAAGAYSTAIGSTASTSNSYGVAVGRGVTNAAFGTVVIGASSSAGSALYQNSMGYSNSLNTRSGSILIGNVLTATANNQLQIGSSSSTYDIRVAIIGRGDTHATPNSNGGVLLRTTDGTGTDIAGEDFNFGAGAPTGSGVGGKIGLFTADAGATGTTLRTRVERMTILGNGNIGIGSTSPTSYLHIGKAGTTAASTAPFKITTGPVNTTAEAGALEYTTPQLFFTNGGAIRQEIPLIQQTRLSTTQTRTTDVTLTDITGLTSSLAAGKTYRFEANIYTTSDIAGGVKFAIGGTATATDIVYEGLATDAGLTTQQRGAALGAAVASVTAVTAAYVRISGTITVNAAGSLTVQFAQNASSGSASSALRGSTFVVTEML